MHSRVIFYRFFCYDHWKVRKYNILVDILCVDTFPSLLWLAYERRRHHAYYGVLLLPRMLHVDLVALHWPEQA